MAAERKLDIFQVLRAIDKRDAGWLSRQPPDAQKEFIPTVVLRWAATAEGDNEGAYMLWMVNENVNVNMYALSKHPELIYRLFATCGLGKVLRHQWIAGPKRKGQDNKAAAFLQQLHPDANGREIDMLIGMYDKDTFAKLVSDAGVLPDEVKELKKAFANISS